MPLKINLKGQMLLELLLAIGLSTLLIPILMLSLMSSRDGRAREKQQSGAVAVLKETEEAVRAVQKSGWNAIPAGSNNVYHPVVTVNSGPPVTKIWTLSNGSELVNGFTREVYIRNVFRLADGKIDPAGTLDPSTKKADIIISWSLPFYHELKSTLYLTRYENKFDSETTWTKFNSGIATTSAVASTSGSIIPDDGQVQLNTTSGRGGGNWCDPGAYVVATYNLTNQGIPKSISATTSATQDYAFTTTGGNASGHAIDGLLISHPTPTANPQVTNPTTNNEGKAYGIFVNNTGSNVYTYVNENHFTVRILDGNTLNAVGQYDNGGTGSSIYINGTTGYTTVSKTLYVFDAGPPFKGVNTSQNQLGSKTITNTMNKVMVRGTHAYVTTSDTTAQLQIFDVSNPGVGIPNPTKINLDNGQAGVDSYIDESEKYAYIVTNYIAGKSDYFIYDLQSSQIVAQGTTMNTITPTGIAVIPGDPVFVIIIGSGASGNLYQVYRFYKPNTINYCNISILSLPNVNTVYGVSAVVQNNGNAYSYIITDNSSLEFQVIAGGTKGEYINSGTYVSRPFDMLADVAFNRFTATASQPASTTLKMQVATATPQGSQTCITTPYTFVGPNGTTGDYYNFNNGNISGLFPRSNISPSYTNPGQCFKYRLELNSSDSLKTPALYDMKVNYSP